MAPLLPYHNNEKKDRKTKEFIKPVRRRRPGYMKKFSDLESDSSSHESTEGIQLVTDQLAADMGRPLSPLRIKHQQITSLFIEWQPWLLRAWVLHIVGCIVVIGLGYIHNLEGRKFIPIDVGKLDEPCVKAFIDVHSPSLESPGSLLCCHADGSNDPFICSPPPRFLLGHRLARFPEAWLLPLFPLLARIAWNFYRRYYGISNDAAKTENKYAVRRFYLYFELIQVRSWILYLLFDKIEDLLVTSAGSGCWYEDLLYRRYHECQGREMDYSDHLVLYFAQILPIALVEVLHCFVIPFWEQGRNYGRATKGLCHPVPLFLLSCLAILYYLTFIGAYKTTAYFHTGPEILLGYLISLLIQVPLFLLQCTFSFPLAREYLFGHPT